MDTKKQSHTLKNRAKELGYDIKLTHAQELVASLKGHRSRHSALLEEARVNLKDRLLIDKLEPLLGSNTNGMVVNTLCQCCSRRPRSKAICIFSGANQIWLLCDECSSSKESKFSKENGAKDLTEHYDIHATYIRDVLFDNGEGTTKGSRSLTKKAFMFRLILSNGELGDRYMFMPGLWSGHSEVTVWNLDKNEAANGWWDWPIILLPMP